MKTYLPLVAISLALFLVGCASPQQQAAYQYQQQSQAEQNQRNAFQSLVNKCEGYGFKSGTTAFAQCLPAHPCGRKASSPLCVS